jgi:hypothetical protein
LFVRPTTYTTLELAAFFYGNKIPLNTALDFFRECNETSSENIEFFCAKYATWERRKDREHMYEYYDMSIGQIVHLNESDHDQCEIMEREMPITIGFGDFFQNVLDKK